MPEGNVLDLFENPSPMLAMLHLAGEGPAEVFDIARREIDDLYEGGVDAVIVENYFGTVDDVEAVLRYLHEQRPVRVHGVNVLGDDARAFELAGAYSAAFIQLDSVAGHLEPGDDPAFAERLAGWRESSRAFVLGGVRFKYQPVLSENPLETDLEIAMGRCDAVVVSSEGTGIETSIAKIETFRRVLGADFPLFIGAGLTVENCRAQLAVADGAIVGSYLKDTYRDDGRVSPAHVRELVQAVHGTDQVAIGSGS